MSGSGFQDQSQKDPDAPPPYSQTAAQHPPQTYLAARFDQLRSELRQERRYQASSRDERDSATLSVLVPHIEDLLSDIAAMRPPPSLVEAVMVPDAAVDQKWHLTEKDDKLKGEVRRIIRVEMVPSKIQGDGKQRDTGPQQSATAPNRGFDEWGRWEDDNKERSASPTSALWWSDEGMARRLAKHLQPARHLTTQPTKPKAVAVQRPPERNSMFSSLFKKQEPRPVPAPEPVGQGPDSKENPKMAPLFQNSRLGRQRPSDEEARHHVSMQVRAEEVTFRRENEMGLWESRTGWGIMLRVILSQT